jgi:hypothetical protein
MIVFDNIELSEMNMLTGSKKSNTVVLSLALSCAGDVFLLFDCSIRDNSFAELYS